MRLSENQEYQRPRRRKDKLIRLDDLIPKQDVKGGRQLLFGVSETTQHNKPNKGKLKCNGGRAANAISYAKFRSRSHRAVIRAYDEAGNRPLPNAPGDSVSRQSIQI